MSFIPRAERGFKAGDRQKFERCRIKFAAFDKREKLRRGAQLVSRKIVDDGFGLLSELHGAHTAELYHASEDANRQMTKGLPRGVVWFGRRRGIRSGSRHWGSLPLPCKMVLLIGSLKSGVATLGGDAHGDY